MFHHVPNDLFVLGNEGEHVDQRRSPIQTAEVDEARGDVARDDRLFMNVGHLGQERLLVARAKEGRGVVQKAPDQGVLRVIG